jgi:hypothetical protein
MPVPDLEPEEEKVIRQLDATIQLDADPYLDPALATDILLGYRDTIESGCVERAVTYLNESDDYTDNDLAAVIRHVRKPKHVTKLIPFPKGDCT